jgi:hypothetical protein
MAEFSRCHSTHQVLDGVVFRAGLDVARHDLTDRFVQRCRPMLGERAHNIALPQDADNAVIGTEDDNRTDASLGQQLYCCRQDQRSARF